MQERKNDGGHGAKVCYNNVVIPGRDIATSNVIPGRASSARTRNPDVKLPLDSGFDRGAAAPE
jgi:hypothetical protein